MPGLAGDLAAHRVEPGAEPANPFHRDEVFRRARPVELAVGKPADERSAGKLADRSVNLGDADVVAAGESAAPRQPPARLTVHESGGYPVGEHAPGYPLSRHLGVHRDELARATFARRARSAAGDRAATRVSFPVCPVRSDTAGRRSRPP